MRLCSSKTLLAKTGSWQDWPGSCSLPLPPYMVGILFSNVICLFMAIFYIVVFKWMQFGLGLQLMIEHMLSVLKVPGFNSQNQYNKVQWIQLNMFSFSFVILKLHIFRVYICVCGDQRSLLTTMQVLEIQFRYQTHWQTPLLTGPSLRPSSPQVSNIINWFTVIFMLSFSNLSDFFFGKSLTKGRWSRRGLG